MTHDAWPGQGSHRFIASPTETRPPRAAPHAELRHDDIVRPELRNEAILAAALATGHGLRPPRIPLGRPDKE